ncbi:MAG TPA: hypothetical protein VG651_18290 [Stellaceae bacterium]|nr:hypothetical protein [Stellaceae bacterium]
MLATLRCPISMTAALFLAALLLAGAALAEGGGGAVATPGSGRLTMCRSWLLFSTCREYNNVALPQRIAPGDRLPLNFGSNPKDYAFPVARIIRNGASCTLLDEPTGTRNDGNRIEITSCRDAGSN